MTIHTCLGGCGKRITWNFALCSECEAIYGRSMHDWPEWIAFLWRDEQRIRRQEKNISAHEVTEADSLPAYYDDSSDCEAINNDWY